MALNRGKLSDVHQVGAGTSVGIVTVTSDKKIYVKSIICHAAGTGINTATAQVYYCPSGITSGPTNKIFDVDVLSGETVLLEPCLLYTSPSPRDKRQSRMPSSA